MKGQWIGGYSGTNSGALILELDEIDDHFEGRAYAYDANPNLPGMCAFIRTPDKSAKANINCDLAPIDKFSGDLAAWENVRSQYPAADVIVPNRAQVSLDWGDGRINVIWTTSIGTRSNAELKQGRSGESSDYVPLSDVTTWDEFRTFVRGLPAREYIFRGQESSHWRLRTHFHRTGRADLLRYVAVDIPSLHQHLSALTTHFFNLTNPIEHGAFVGLAQHHGYPTPLLDWTHSPFIAAYFAFKKARLPITHVRVFVFNEKQWRADFNQLTKITPAKPHFSLAKFVSINNLRMVPQQALSSITNVDDIEEYIRARERENEKEYLRVIDLPIGERAYAMSELRLMGITAGYLFPGLDGACEQFKELMFDA